MGKQSAADPRKERGPYGRHIPKAFPCGCHRLGGAIRQADGTYTCRCGKRWRVDVSVVEMPTNGEVGEVSKP